MAPTATALTFQHDAKAHTLTTPVVAVRPVAALGEEDRALHKAAQDGDFVVVTEATIFHPQGGGQPSDVGTMRLSSGAGTDGATATNAATTFEVEMVRMSATRLGEALHFGRFTTATTTTDAGADADAPSPASAPPSFGAGDLVEQAIDPAKRLLYSRYHTAGHVLGAAVGQLARGKVEGFEELKASHFPGQASCEFRGLLEGSLREPSQRVVDELVSRDLAVSIAWWGEEDFRARGLERLIPAEGTREAMGLAPGAKFRVVDIGGADVYPCGGTHVDSTALCGKTEVKKISRSKGVSRVSYTLPG